MSHSRPPYSLSRPLESFRSIHGRPSCPLPTDESPEWFGMDNYVLRHAPTAIRGSAVVRAASASALSLESLDALFHVPPVTRAQLAEDKALF